MSYPFIMQGDNITVVIDSTPYTINKTHVVFERVKEAIKTGNWAVLPDLVEPKTAVIKYASGNVSIDGSTFLWKGKPMHNVLSNKLIDMLKEGFPIEPLVAFMHNLMQNPSKRAVDELYGFLEKGNLPITPDGYFLAYKKVREDYKDCHTGTMDNSVGKVVEMDRNEVDDDKDRTCSAGLHFCSQEYLNNFGGARTVILKINPRDVVSIPSDYNDSKGRACRYEVIGELAVDPSKAFVKAVQDTAVGSEPVKLTAHEPKIGSGPFSRGYNDGYNGLGYNNIFSSYKERVAYTSGFDAGTDDVDRPARYAYVPKQEFDSKGRPLSMTKDAIRKREARARARARQVSVAPKSLWPKPKGF